MVGGREIWNNPNQNDDGLDHGSSSGPGEKWVGVFCIFKM